MSSREIEAFETQKAPRQGRILSFAQWCALLGISSATGRRLLASGDGPPVVRLSARRIGIDADDNEIWLNSRKTKAA